jgi:hypothetical protein
MRAIAIVGMLALLGGVARADDEPRPPPEPGFYGHHIAIVDGVAVGLTGLGFHLLYEYLDCECEEMGSGVLIMLGVGTYAMMPAMLHHERKRTASTVGSVSLRVGLPVMALIVADERDASTAWKVGATLGGAATAMVIDWSLLSNDRRKVAPVVAPVTDGVAVGVAGAF